MLRSMTGFGRCFLEEQETTQVWEVRSVNGRYLDTRWRLPMQARPFETALEKVVKKHATRGRLEITLSLQMHGPDAYAVSFHEEQAEAMLNAMVEFAESRGDTYDPDYSRFLGLSFLWQDESQEPNDDLLASLEKGLILALEDWNESRELEAKALAKDIGMRTLLMHEWVELIKERAPDIKAERFNTVHERLGELLSRVEQDLDESRFSQEIAFIADKLDVSEELTRLDAHLSRLQELMDQGTDAGKKLDFTLQECFREVTTCSNKIQDLQLSHLMVDLKTELEKCREQVQNLE